MQNELETMQADLKKKVEELENMTMAYRNEKSRANRNEYLVESAKAFESEVVWLRALVEKLTAKQQ